jgi:hypothetical protein
VIEQIDRPGGNLIFEQQQAARQRPGLEGFSSVSATNAVDDRPRR